MKGIIGAIAGDIIGSVYEHHRIKTKDFDLFSGRSIFTDDTVMTLAIARWLCEDKTSNDALVQSLLLLGNEYPNAGYGGRFIHWLTELNPQPYGSWANGSAMRVSPCAWVANSLEETQKLAEMSAMVTHNHPEGVKGALSTADAIYLARTGVDKEEIREHVQATYGYDLDRTVEEIRPNYSFDVSCKGSIPESIICFLDGENFEDTIRNAVSLGGDSDTIAAIAGSIASAYWEVPYEIADRSFQILDGRLMDIFIRFEEKFM